MPLDRGNGSSYTNSTAGAGGTNTVTADSSFEVQINQNGNDAVVNPNNCGEPQKGGAAINSSSGAVNSGGTGAIGIGDIGWSYGGGGGSGGRLKVKFTNTTKEVITFDLVVGAKAKGWKNGGNSGQDGGIGFAIVSTS
ncbi:hypothetical protein LZZ98_00220 [Acinetobacter sp. SM34]|uniref:hypothetical protein n=1 Tax=Acinetobacter sp. SM34 TaxID=1301620 RepID=UPI001EDAA0D7|nr:hypothetical protein [Acinetobacter sp. SM34]MCG2607000.1 hypothetical protein [Acinetobacter sp. SM34]